MEHNFTHMDILWRLDKKPVAFGCMWHRVHRREYNELFANGDIVIVEHDDGSIYYELCPNEQGQEKETES